MNGNSSSTYSKQNLGIILDFFLSLTVHIQSIGKIILIAFKIHPEFDYFSPPPPLPLTQVTINSHLDYSSVQFSHSVVSLCHSWTAACQPSLSITNSWSLLKLMSIESVMPSSHLILCRPLLLLPSIFPSIRVFSDESALHLRWPKCWSFSFNISPSNEHSGLISFRMDWLDLLAIQGTLKSLPQHHSSKASILRCSAFFIVQLSHPYMPTGKP